MKADHLYLNGNILTQDIRVPRVEAMAILDGRIAAIGRSHEIDHLRGKGTKVHDLKGATLLPGFNDAHVHVWKVGHLLTSLLDLRGVKSLSEMKKKLKIFADSHPEMPWVMARGYNEGLWDEGDEPTRYDLDDVIPDRPVYLIRTCAHVAVANSKALELAGIDNKTMPPPGGEITHDSKGVPTGRLTETALGLVTRVMPQMTVADYQKTITAAIENQLSLGITSATDPAVTPDLIEAYRQLDQEGKLKNRLNLLSIRRPDGGTSLQPLPEMYCSDFLRIDSVKFFADGGLSGATAAVTRPYKHVSSTGVLRFSHEEFLQLTTDCVTQGYRVATHAIGDVAIDQVISVYHELKHIDKSLRHRIEHCGLPTHAHLMDIARQGTIIVTQPPFIHELGKNFHHCLDDTYLSGTYPYKSMMTIGITTAFSSDAPVVKDNNPITGIHAAMTRQSADGLFVAPSEAVRLDQCLYSYTMAGAIASGDQANRGSLIPGKWADFVVLNHNIEKVPAEELMKVKVRQTWVGGMLLHEA